MSTPIQVISSVSCDPRCPSQWRLRHTTSNCSPLDTMARSTQGYGSALFADGELANQTWGTSVVLCRMVYRWLTDGKCMVREMSTPFIASSVFDIRKRPPGLKGIRNRGCLPHRTFNQDSTFACYDVTPHTELMEYRALESLECPKHCLTI